MAKKSSNKLKVMVISVGIIILAAFIVLIYIMSGLETSEEQVALVKAQYAEELEARASREELFENKVTDNEVVDDIADEDVTDANESESTDVTGTDVTETESKVSELTNELVTIFETASEATKEPTNESTNESTKEPTKEMTTGDDDIISNGTKAEEHELISAEVKDQWVQELIDENRSDIDDGDLEIGSEIYNKLDTIYILDLADDGFTEEELVKLQVYLETKLTAEEIVIAQRLFEKYNGMIQQ